MKRRLTIELLELITDLPMHEWGKIKGLRPRIFMSASSTTAVGKLRKHRESSRWRRNCGRRHFTVLRHPQ